MPTAYGMKRRRLFIIMLILLMHFFRVRQLKHRKKELSREVNLRTRELKERHIDLEQAHRNIQEVNTQMEAKNSLLEEQSKKLAELDQAKSRFFANISHEFRTPLTLIKGPLEQILQEKPDKVLESRAQLMLRNSKRLLNLVEQLLELARFDSGTIRLEVSEQDISAFVKRIVMCFESPAQQNDIALEFRGDSEEIPLYFDRDKIERILFNLLSNAFNYTASGGSIRVSLERVCDTSYPSGSVEISVKDTGQGIPPDQLPFIFDRFFRGEGAHGFHRKGTGIGLALVRELVELHHGNIEARSTRRTDSTDGGTEFFIRLPMGHDHFQPREITAGADREPRIDHDPAIPDTVQMEQG